MNSQNTSKKRVPVGGGSTGSISPKSYQQRNQNAFNTGRLNDEFGSENSFNSSLQGLSDFDGSVNEIQSDHPCLSRCPAFIGNPLMDGYDWVQDEVFVKKCGCAKDSCFRHTMCWAIVIFVALFLALFALEDFAAKYSYSTIDLNWREKLKIDSSVDVMTPDGRWCPAVITDASETKITVRPQDENEEDFEFHLDRDTPRIDLPGKKTSNQEIQMQEFDMKLKAHIEEQQQATQKLQKALNAKGNDIDAIKKEIDVYSNSLDKVQEKVVTAISDFQTRMDLEMKAIDDNVQKIQKNVDSLESRITSLESEQFDATQVQRMVDSRVNELCSPKVNELRKEFNSVLGSSGSGTVTWEKIEDLIDESVNYYIYADATGEVDYISDVVQCSATFTHYDFFDRVMAVALGAYKPCDKVLEPVRRSGDCWPMEGSEGYLIFKLSKPIEVTHIRMDHIDQRVSTKPDTTPKNFKISVSETKGGPFEDLPLVSSKYVIDGGASQIFQTEEEASKKLGFVNFVKFDILSNYGNEFYTCLYRLRVHGKQRTVDEL